VQGPKPTSFEELGPTAYRRAGSLFAGPGRPGAVFHDEVGQLGMGDPSVLGEGELAVDDARDVLDFREALVDSLAGGGAFLDRVGDDEDRVVGDGREEVGILVVLGPVGLYEGLDLGTGVVREELRGGVDAFGGVSGDLEELGREDGRVGDDRSLGSLVPELAGDQGAVRIVRDEDDGVGGLPRDVRDRRTEVLIRGKVGLAVHDRAAEGLHIGREEIEGRFAPVGIQVEDRELFQAKGLDRILGEARCVVLLGGRVAPHVVPALGEIGVGVGEPELGETCTLVDRGGGHRGRAREVTEFGDDLRIRNEFLGDGDRLLRIALAVLEDVGEGAAGEAARAVDLEEGEVEALLPLGSVLGVVPGERSRDPEIDRGFRIGGEARESRQCHKGCDGQSPSRDPGWIAG
jgi:hypothetical protein